VATDGHLILQGSREQRRGRGSGDYEQALEVEQNVSMIVIPGASTKQSREAIERAEGVGIEPAPG
jgi:hypothetical protein